MARKKPARPGNRKPAQKAKKAKKKAAPKAAARKTVKKAARKPAGKAKAVKKKAARKAVAKARPAAKARVSKPAKKAASTKRKAAPISAKTKASKPAKKASPAKAVAAPIAPTKKPNLDRPRKTVADIHGIPSSLGMGGIASAAHSGYEELKDTLKKNTSASPRLTAGDVDADWQSAESVGDEAPGGDNPTPDQDVVDEIGRALGVEYADDEELQGGAEITERDTHRWELDPSSKEDFEDE